MATPPAPSSSAVLTLGAGPGVVWELAIGSCSFQIAQKNPRGESLYELDRGVRHARIQRGEFHPFAGGQIGQVTISHFAGSSGS